MWINNCVGGQNYRSFLVMILSAFSNLLISVITIILLTVQGDFHSYLGGFVVAWISGAINSVFTILLINLIILHIYLLCKGMSTYEFIMAQREAERREKEE